MSQLGSLASSKKCPLCSHRKWASSFWTRLYWALRMIAHAATTGSRPCSHFPFAKWSSRSCLTILSALYQPRTVAGSRPGAFHPQNGCRARIFGYDVNSMLSPAWSSCSKTLLVKLAKPMIR